MTARAKPAKDPVVAYLSKPIMGRHPHQQVEKPNPAKERVRGNIPVIVVWDDAWGHDTAYDTTALVEKCKDPCIRRTLGFVVIEDETQIVIAGTDDRDGVEAGGDWDAINRIPAGMVKEVIELVPRAK
jgi:hypothetical protein